MSFIDRQQQPILILDSGRCKRNISRMAERAKQADCEFRPHFKTHQSQAIGRWFRDERVDGITVSSVSMAQYFAEDGWDDITIAFPFFPQQVQGLKQLELKSELRLFVNSTDHLALLHQELSNPFKFYIEIDSDYGRSGILYKNVEQIRKLIESSERFEKANFHGFYIHDGRTYNSRGEDQIRDAVNPTIDILADLKKQFPEAKISLGDTPSASVSGRLNELDEITPGNFVFYDYMQVQIGSCSLDDVALFAVLPVGQTFPESGRSILHGGAVHLSKEFITPNNSKNFGQVIQHSPGSKITEAHGLFLTGLSQEHGTLNGLPTAGEEYVWVCPIHSCLTANLHRNYFTQDGENISKRILS